MTTYDEQFKLTVVQQYGGQIISFTTIGFSAAMATMSCRGNIPWPASIGNAIV
jgi:hypothetical protein